MQMNIIAALHFSFQSRRAGERLAGGLKIALFILCSSACSATCAQEDLPQLQPETESVWQFGMKVNSAGVATGIFATSPVPIQCPEQTLELISEERLGSVGRIKLKPLKPNGRQMMFKIDRMQPGEEALAATTFRITKRDITAPEKTDRFRFAARPSGQLRFYLGESPYIETDDKKVIAISKDLQKKNAQSNAWDQVEAIYTWVRENIKYKFDTQIHSCVEALETGTGDCEELSSLFIALCRVQNIPARAVWIPGHTYPEFYLEDENGKGHWFPCQAAGTYQFGCMSEQRPILQKGDRFKVSGQRELVRYAQPTLKCKDASGAIGIEQIAEQIE